MKVLLVAATPFEIAPVIIWLENEFESIGEGHFKKGELEVQLCITGIGMLATGWRLGCVYARELPTFAINAGIAGALDSTLKLGDVVYVATEQLADVGVEEASGKFSDLFETGLLDANTFPFSNGNLQSPGSEQVKFLPKVHGITVNKVHGSAPTIAALQHKYPDAQIESMEGGAFFYSCLLAGVPFIQIRSISNYVSPRNRADWNLPLAIQSLNDVLVQILKEYLFEQK